MNSDSIIIIMNIPMKNLLRSITDVLAGLEDSRQLLLEVSLLPILKTMARCIFSFHVSFREKKTLNINFIVRMKKLKNIFKAVKSSVPWPEDNAAHTDSTSTYFRHTEAKDIPKDQYKMQNKTKFRVEDRIRELDRVILKGIDKDFIMIRIQEIILQSRLHNVPEDVKDACEIAHYAILNDTPVRVSLLRLIVPEIEFSEKDIIDENSYEKYLQKKEKEDNIQEATIEVEDTYGMRNEEGRGKTSHTTWGPKNTNK